MRTRGSRVASAMALVLCLLWASQSRANLRAEKRLVKDALESWQVLRKNVKVHKVVNEKAPDGTRTLGGDITLFGQRGALEVGFFKAPSGSTAPSEIRRIAIQFPEGAKLTTRHVEKLFRMKTSALLPGHAGASVGIDHLEVEMRSKKVGSATIGLNFGTWAPMGAGGKGKVVTLSDIEAEFALRNLQVQPEFSATLNTYLLLPENLARTMGVGETELRMSGSVNSSPLAIRLGVDLASKEIPLVPNRAVVMRNAGFDFVYEGGRPALAMRGKIELRPKSQAPIALNGQLSISATGAVYAEGWMEQSDSWRNPFGISNNLYLTRAGLGFGANFATGIPMPIVGIEGGLLLKDGRGQVRAKGHVTLGVDSGNPTRSVLDAELGSIQFADLVTALQGVPIPREFAATLRKLTLHKVRLSIVPPGPGVTLFGVGYEPGIKAEADFSYENFRGTMLIDMDKGGVTAFGGMTPVRGNGFALTGTKSGTGPSIYVALRPKERVFALALNGQLEVLGNRALADIHLSDAGFSAKVRTKLGSGVSTELDIAGTGLSSRASVYAKAQLSDRDGLVQQMTTVAANQIDAAAKALNRDIDTKRRALQSLTPRLAAKKRELSQKQAEVRRDLEKNCRKLDQRKAQEAEKQRKEAELRALRERLRRAEAKLASSRHRPAKAIRSLKCPRGAAAAHDHCWTCPGGTKRDILQRWDSGKACFKEQGFLKPVKYYRANKGAYIGCSTIRDLGKCWECPSGYARKISVHRIDSAKACDLRSTASMDREINSTRATIVRKDVELVGITKGIGKLASELSAVAANSCSVAKNTDLINVDPRVAPTYRAWSKLNNELTAAKTALDIAQATTSGTMGAASWITRHAGRAAGVVRIQSASFEGCLSALNGGSVAMHVRGTFADRPFQGSLDVNLANPAAAAKQLAQSLAEGRPLRASRSNGSCRRPQVPRPNAGGQIGAAIANLQRSHKGQGKTRPKNTLQSKPNWAPKRRRR